MGSTFITSVVNYFKSFTIEPVIFLYILGSYSVSGVQVTANVMMYKVCSVEMELDDRVCENLSDYPDILDKVQIRWTQLSIGLGWIQHSMYLFYAFFAGALSDVFGRKPLIWIPLVGQCLGTVLEIINYAFLRTLPLEFIYASSISSFFGGLGIYYLGVYGYGASITEPHERAYRLARLDGVETLAIILATLLSPTINSSLGPNGNYGFALSLTLLAIIYLKLFVREPIKHIRNVNESGEKIKSPSPNYLYQICVLPLINMKCLLMRKRAPMVKILMAALFIIYSIYNFAYEASNAVLYLYMLKVFDDFQPADYAYYYVFMNVGNAAFLFLFMPLVSGKLKLRDSTLLITISICETFSNLVSPFVTNLWLFYAAQFVHTIGYCKYATARSLLSKCVDDDEIGKTFALQSILNAFAHMTSAPIVKQLYIVTIGTFPGAFFLLSASLTLAGGFGNLFIVANESRVHKAKIESALETQESNNDEKLENTGF